MRLLILDFFRRYKWLILLLGIPLILKAAVGPVSLGLAAMGFWIGLMLGFRIEARVILQLPISRREIWRTRWILWNLFPVVALAGVRLLVLSSTMNIQPSWILLSSAMELSFLGTLYVASAIIESCACKLLSPPKALFIKYGFYIAVVGLTGFISPDLPTQWSQWTSPMIIVLVFGLALTAISYFYSPPIGPRAERFRPSTRPLPPHLNARPRREGPVGMELLLRRQLGMILVGAIAAGIASQSPLIVVELLNPHGGSALDRMILFIEPIPTGALFSFIAPVLVNAVLLIFAPDFIGLRHLRILPLRTWMLGLMLTLIPALFWLVFWVFPLSVYWILARHLPSSLRLDILAGMAGLACLAGAAGLHSTARDPGQRVVLPFLTVPAFILLSHRLPWESRTSLLVGILGMAGVAVSFWLNCRALERKNGVYVALLRAATRPDGFAH